MVVASTVKDWQNTGGAAGSLTSTSRSYASGSRVILFVCAQRNSHTNGLGTSITPTTSATTNTITWTEVADSGLDTAQGATFATRSYTYISSELTDTESFTVSFDPGTSTYFIGLITKEQTGGDGTTIDVGTYGDEPEPGTPTGMANPTSGDYQTFDAAGQVDGDITSWDAPPTNFTDQSGGETLTNDVCLNAMESSTNTDGTVSYGLNPTGTTLFNLHLHHISWTAAATGTTATAETATGTGDGVDPVPVVAPEGVTGTGTGTGQAASATVAPTAGTASGTGTGVDATIAVQPAAGTAAGTGVAPGPAASVAPTAGTATGTGSGVDATVDTSTATTATAETATGTGDGVDGSTAIAPGAGTATGTGTGVDGSVAVAPGAGTATGSGSGIAPSPTIAPGAGTATGTGTALDGTVSTDSGTTAAAGTATGTGTGVDAGGAVAVPAGTGSGTGAAGDASPGVSPSAGTGTGTGAGNGATAVVAPTAGTATGTGTGIDASGSGSIETTATAETATGTGTGIDATVETVDGQRPGLSFTALMEAQRRAAAEAEARRGQPRVCPNDGTLLEHDGDRWACPWDGWTPAMTPASPGWV